MRLWTLHTLSGMSQIVNRKSHLSHWSQSELSSPRTLLHVGLRPYKASRPRTLASKNSGRQYELRVHVDGLRLTLTLCLLRLPLCLRHACTKSNHPRRGSSLPLALSLSLSDAPAPSSTHACACTHDTQCVFVWCLCGVCCVCVWVGGCLVSVCVMCVGDAQRLPLASCAFPRLHVHATPPPP